MQAHAESVVFQVILPIMVAYIALNSKVLSHLISSEKFKDFTEAGNSLVPFRALYLGSWPCQASALFSMIRGHRATINYRCM